MLPRTLHAKPGATEGRVYRDCGSDELTPSPFLMQMEKAPLSEAPVTCAAESGAALLNGLCTHTRRSPDEEALRRSPFST